MFLPFVGIGGVGRIMSGHTAIGVLRLVGLLLSFPLMLVLIGFVTAFAFWLWCVIDGILMLSGNVTDAQGRPLRP